MSTPHLISVGGRPDLKERTDDLEKRVTAIEAALRVCVEQAGGISDIGERLETALREFRYK